jgi:hypothetical protein
VVPRGRRSNGRPVKPFRSSTWPRAHQAPRAAAGIGHERALVRLGQAGHYVARAARHHRYNLAGWLPRCGARVAHEGGRGTQRSGLSRSAQEHSQTVLWACPVVASIVASHMCAPIR